MVVTATRRLARALHQDYARAQGGRVWPSAEILPLDQWLEAGWTTLRERAGPLRHGPTPELLGPTRERLVWEQIVAASPQGGALLHLDAAAALAQEAWTLLCQFGLSLEQDLRGPRGPDAEAFLGWARTFEQRCRDQGWLPRGELLTRLGAGVAQGLWPVPRRLLLAGFDRLTPQQEALVQLLRKKQCVVEPLPTPAHRPAPRRLALEDRRAEVQVAARWVRHQLERRPGARVGLVVPELEPLREALHDALSDTLAPGALEPAESPHFNISLGPCLARYPVVHAALALLRLGGEPPELARWGALLRSPYLGGAEAELCPRGLLDARLRRLGQVRLSLAEVLRHAAAAPGADGPEPPHRCPELASRLRRARELWGDQPQRQDAAGWTRTFRSLLARLGWPGERTPDSREYQAVTQWKETLATFAGLADLLGPLSLEAATDRLAALAGETAFQPQAEEEAPVQVMGVLEAAGLEFERLWLLGMDEGAWPRAPRPNPLLPVALQRSRGMPRSGPAQELAFARQVTARLLAAAPQTVVSFPLREGDTELRPSPLLRGIPAMTPDELPQREVTHPWRVLHGSATLELLVDQRGSPLQGEEVRGGTGIFRAQAACPFQAYGRYRLGARALEVVRPGLSAADRGVLVHKVLERVWQRLGSGHTLEGCAPDEVRGIAAEVVRRVLEQQAGERPGLFGGALTALERRRLERLLASWLELELSRPPFHEVKVEQSRAIEVGGITVEGRVDRLDRLAGGGWAVIDYKTGDQSLRALVEPRPDEPQLLVYALSTEEDVVGVSFAQLKAGKMRFLGLAERDDVAAGVKPVHEAKEVPQPATWREQVRRWRGELEILAAEFRAGDARVEPKRGPQTCRLCDLAPLCRVEEARAAGRRAAEEEQR